MQFDPLKRRDFITLIGGVAAVGRQSFPSPPHCSRARYEAVFAELGMESSPRPQPRRHRGHSCEASHCRTIRSLREDKLIAIDGKVVTILDFEALSLLSDFENSYLGATARALGIK